MIGCEGVHKACTDFFADNSINNIEITELDQGKEIIVEAYGNTGCGVFKGGIQN